MPEPKTPETTSTSISEDKLFGLLLLGLAVVLLIGLLVWRAVSNEADTELLPTADEKHAIWFDENGVVRKSQSSTTAPQSNQPALVDLQKPAAKPAITPAARSTAHKAPVSSKPSPDYWIQLASFSQRANAEALRDKVSSNSGTVEVAENQRGEQKIYAVRVLVFGDRAKAERLSQSIAKRYGLKPLVMTAK